jgi:hypothetical protein
LAPKKLFREELADWRRTFRFYSVLKVHIIAGRRDHFCGKANDGRKRIISRMNQELPQTARVFGAGLEIMSYDRILDGIAKEDA